LHPVPTAIEQHGTERPAEWPERLESYPDWLSDKEKVRADTEHWKAIVEKSYLTGIGIDWTNIRNVMDMKAIYGGYAFDKLIIFYVLTLEHDVTPLSFLFFSFFQMLEIVIYNAN